MPQNPIFHDYTFGAQERKELDHVGHFVLPDLLTADAQQRLTESLARVESLIPGCKKGYEPNRFAAEYDSYLESLIAHPQMLKLVRQVLGEDIRYDHCVSLNRPGGNRGIHWHSHAYAEDDPRYGFIRIFFYVNGFAADDGGLKAVPGSHLYRDPKIQAATDDTLREGWLAGKTHPQTGDPLAIEALSVPRGTVVLMWTHAAHAVTPRKQESDTRWTVVYGYYKSGKDPGERWITPEFEQKRIPGAEELMLPY
ncbi:phytanoyl-CoA dioxygenase family protein [Candidatus Poribacteria bacterium]|nr:phytanoyl-CoA dioxygenase family protein [Candidatus Poribacteria bacterium]MYH82454.1 phytanoyl-CoA dioxygenase family protein [Candidatus Poribacteria bacterium]MYK94819.1 phytanoyl-CoA dioxygenase family protein [Candidatus Poribacteria bacterium]